MNEVAPSDGGVRRRCRICLSPRRFDLVASYQDDSDGGARERRRPAGRSPEVASTDREGARG